MWNIGRHVAQTALLFLVAGSDYRVDATATDSMSAETNGGACAIWIFANLSFTAMRAQDRGNAFWKILTFILGFPATLLTLLVVRKGSERAYGIDLPRRS